MFNLQFVQQTTENVDNINVKKLKLATKLFLNVFAKRDSKVFQFTTSAQVYS